ncbi:MAG: peptidoglycan bridge formation glycyltransferase FemA/FemB family protein [Chloroflexi bacterium]|nr:peptidoglycan bridge formation glycyltransferase FemA/FemB family protein [Chloroflexota bacterium]
MRVILTIREIDERENWNARLRDLPYAHALQTWEWGEFKRASGPWTPLRLAFERGGRVLAMASLLTRSMGPLKVMYVSKGPVLDYSDTDLAAQVLGELEARAKRFGVVWLKTDPDVIAATGLPKSADDQSHELGRAVVGLLRNRGWRFSDSQVQFRNTLSIDLSRSEDEILAAMSGNTRRKIRVAAKKGVVMRTAAVDDLPLLYRLYKITGERDGFLIRPFDYYRLAWEQFMLAGLAQAFIAEYQGAAIAHVILFHFGRKCWYFYGASSNEERARMPNYALQWAAIRWAKAQGYATYDMWGAPDAFDESDSLWGVYQFKRGFRGQLTRHIGAWDFVSHPTMYYIYQQAAPKLMGAI